MRYMTIYNMLIKLLNMTFENREFMTTFPAKTLYDELITRIGHHQFN